MRCMTPLGVKGHLKVRVRVRGLVFDTAALTAPGLCVCPHSASHYNVRFQLITMENDLLIIYVNVVMSCCHGNGNKVYTYGPEGDTI